MEQRKRVTIGVELAARPELLLFLDEPTSGLDSDTAWSICTLLRKLAHNKQTILCTIHQPSGVLFQMFDTLLFLSHGKSVYFGDIGVNSKTMTAYFEKRGVRQCAPDGNPAEWLLDVTGGAQGRRIPSIGPGNGGSRRRGKRSATTLQRSRRTTRQRKRQQAQQRHPGSLLRPFSISFVSPPKGLCSVTGERHHISARDVSSSLGWYVIVQNSQVEAAN